MKEQYVLFSPVGKTDPLRDEYDGPMLHIIRHYNPHKAVLFLSAAICKIEEKNHWYTRYIEKYNDQIDIELIKSGIEDVSDFNAFRDQFQNALLRISEQFPKEIILLNISSGTPQMTGMLCVLAATMPLKLKMIQVKTPQHSDNAKVAHNDPSETIYDTMEDIEPGTAPNRCVEVQLDNYVHSILDKTLSVQIKAGDYIGAERIAGENAAYLSAEFKNAIKGAACREGFLPQQAKALFDKAGVKDVLPVQNEPWRSIAEYYLRLRQSVIKGEYDAFVLRMPPLALKMALYVLKEKCKLNLERYTNTGKPNNNKISSIKLSVDKLRNDFPKLVQYMEVQFGSELRDDYLKLITLIYIMNYYAKDNAAVAALSVEFEWVRLIEENLRHSTAHELRAVTEGDILDCASEPSVKNVMLRFSKLFYSVYEGTPIHSGMEKNYEKMDRTLLDLLNVAR